MITNIPLNLNILGVYNSSMVRTGSKSNRKGIASHEQKLFYVSECTAVLVVGSVGCL